MNNSRILLSFKFIIFIVLILLGCESDPLKFNSPFDDTMKRNIFSVDQFSIMSNDSISVGNSGRLYTGFINDTTESLILLGIRDLSFSLHPICSDRQSIVSSKASSFVLYSSKLLNGKIEDQVEVINIDTSKLEIDFISGFTWDETILLQNNTDLEIIKNLQGTALPFSIENYELIVSLDSLNIEAESWCENESFVRISYSTTTNENFLKYIEFYSSEYSPIWGPKFDINFSISEESDLIFSQFNLIDINSPIANYYHYLVNDTVPTWFTFYTLNTLENNSFQLDSPLLLDSLSYSSDLIDSSLINRKIDIMTLDIELNQEVIDSIDYFSLQIKDVATFISKQDPSGDNGSDSLFSDGNGKYDLGELFFDFGEDNCTDEYEDGNGNCFLEKSQSPYNETGTENNGLLDFGEDWIDCGIDRICNGSIGDDTNDDYNIDPEGDDYSLENINGTENNGLQDGNEIFLDYGTDGIPLTFDPDSTENNEKYDLGEILFDTGADLLYSDQEFGYNSSGTEGNGKYDLGEEINDYGIDGIQANLPGDSIQDDYNVDPNSDNTTEGNGVLDWNDGNGNGVWDLGEGEQWFDWGIDQIPDSLEQFQLENLPYVSLGQNDYEISTNFEKASYQMPDFGENQIAFWISSIDFIDDLNRYRITFSINSKIELLAMAFGITHNPIVKKSEQLITYDQTLTYVNNDKLIRDISIYTPVLHDYDESLITVNYAMGIEPFLTSTDLNQFISLNPNVLIASKNTYINLGLDTSNTYIDESGSVLFLSGVESGNSFVLDSIPVLPEDVNIKLPLGNIIQNYVNDNYKSDFNGFYLSLSNLENNLSNLVIDKSRSYIEVLYK